MLQSICSPIQLSPLPLLLLSSNAIKLFLPK